MSDSAKDKAPVPKKGNPPLVDQPVTPDLNSKFAAEHNGEATVDRTTYGANEHLWYQSDIDGIRWDKLFPYQLVILKAEASKDGKKTTYTPSSGNMSVFTLPVPPESMTISMPFAISTAATLRGVVEEHNGAPFRNISISGQSGVLLQRGQARQSGETPWYDHFIGGGTAAEFGSNTLTSLGRIFDFNNSLLKNGNLHETTEFSDNKNLLAKSTGYFQMQLLQRFFENYAALKKSHEGHEYRLGFAVWKEKSVYLVTPQAFNVEKSQNSPLSYQYNIVFKAFARVNVYAGDSRDFTVKSLANRPGFMFQAINTLSEARRSIQTAEATIGAVLGAAAGNVKELVRETSLFAKASIGFSLTVADLPTSIMDKIEETEQFITNEDLSLDTQVNKFTKERWQQWREWQSTEDRYQNKKNKEVSTATSGGFRNVQDDKLTPPPPKNTPGMGTDDPNHGSDDLEINKMELTEDIKKAIADEVNRVLQTTRKEFETMRDQFRAMIDALADAIGLGSETYNKTFAVPAAPVRKKERDITDADYTLLYDLNAAAAVMDSFAATGINEPSSTQARVSAMAQAVRRTGTAFNEPVSKFAVPFPYGVTLESLSVQYLGTPDRWHEIAALNGLKEPYVDEVGFDVYLLVNGFENTVVVPTAVAKNLYYVGQTAFVWSDGVRRTRRIIQSIKEKPDGTTEIILSGDSDLSMYTLAQKARLSAFLPDTVNSQGMIYIPSDETSLDEDFITKSIPGVDEFDPMVAVGGVDFLTDNHNNLIVTPQGDNAWAVGLTNILQSLRSELSVRRGSLLRHPDYGLPVVVGNSTAETNPRQILEAIRKMVSNNGSISRVDAIRISKNGPAMTIDALVVVKGTEKPVPIRYGVMGDKQTT